MREFKNGGKVKLSVVVPVYNEEDAVDKLVDRINRVCSKLGCTYEIIVVDDGSRDKTWTKIERLKETHPSLVGIKLRRNYGQTNAMVAGFEYSSGDVIITMDGDLQNDPSDIPDLLSKMEEGYDLVSGWRKDRKDHWSRVLPSRIANRIISLTTGVRLHDYGCSLKAYRAECIKSLKAYGEMHRFFPALASMTGARVAEVAVRHYPREFGRSKYGFSRIFKVLSDIMAINLIIKFSSKPLMGFAICAIPFFLIASSFGCLGLAAAMFQWTSGKALSFVVFGVLLSMAGSHLIFMGILAELVVGTSDLTHAQMPELTKRSIEIDFRE